MKPFYRTILITLLLLLVQACSDDGSPEDQIRHLIDSAVQTAEDRSLDDLNDLLHDDFIDQYGNNRRQLARLLRAYFFRHKSLHLFVRTDSIEMLSANQASVSLHVAMAGTVISDVSALTSLSARIYRFELQLVKQGDWLLRHASWEPASIGVFE
ncbi:MAG: nuclear transport factor 2 family protein [Gammaproteobacteria bacterium]|nr:nuclear transport factor 2 family protein [Gammaproteobacteria bacterium]